MAVQTGGEGPEEDGDGPRTAEEEHAEITQTISYLKFVSRRKILFCTI